MLTAVEGLYRDGKVELLDNPVDVPNGTRVVVTFLATAVIDLRARGISEAQAFELRSEFATFADDWNSPEMDIYDDYDAAKATL